MASTETNAPTVARIARSGAPAPPEVTRVLYGAELNCADGPRIVLGLYPYRPNEPCSEEWSGAMSAVSERDERGIGERRSTGTRVAVVISVVSLLLSGW
jgi:hypothetical protein